MKSEELRAIIYPTRDDPRWLILGFLLCCVAYALTAPGFSRHPAQFIASLGTAVLLDALLLASWRGVRLVPLSGLITSLGTVLLCDSPRVWPYAAVAGLSIASKHFIRSEKRHVFNPNNFGIVAAILLWPGEVTVMAGRWGGSAAGMALVACLGIPVAWRVKRLDLTASYVGSWLAGAAARAVLKGLPYASACAPATGTAFWLFTFYMITDPMTTPASSRERWIFGLVLGALDNLLRYFQVYNSPFYALFALTALRPLWAGAPAAAPWRTARLSQQRLHGFFSD